MASLAASVLPLQPRFFVVVVLFLAVLGLCCCVHIFSSCGRQGLLFSGVHGLLIAVASLVTDHRL